jgi:hypothetical protein
MAQRHRDTTLFRDFSSMTRHLLPVCRIARQFAAQYRLNDSYPERFLFPLP